MEEFKNILQNFNFIHSFSKSKNEIKKIGIEFDTPKPTNLIKFLINLYNKKNNPIILDFFASSGTTGQAVMELNEEDGRNRRFILCTNNENNIAREMFVEKGFIEL